MFRTAEVSRFYAAWQELRSENAVPHYRRVFEAIDHALIPQIAVLEETPAAARGGVRHIVRFLGTRLVELWGRDITDQDWLGELPPRRADSWRRNAQAVLDHPCALYSFRFFRLRERSDVDMEVLNLPAANDPSRPRRLIKFIQEVRPVPYSLAEDGPAERRWLDLGFGVPGRGPG